MYYKTYTTLVLFYCKGTGEGFDVPSLVFLLRAAGTDSNAYRVQIHAPAPVYVSNFDMWLCPLHLHPPLEADCTQTGGFAVF